MNQNVLNTIAHEKNSHQLEVYKSKGGYSSLVNLINITPEQVINEVKKSNLRGRGGAGFPTAKKWTFLPNDDRARYLVCNADEGEPGTFKDRFLMNKLPHQIIEGMIIAAYAIKSKTAYIYIRGEFVKEYKIMEQALKEAYDANILGKDLNIYLYRGAGAYICGEETALLNSLEGKRGEPRNKPPFPAHVGAFGMPTCVNNVETFTSLPWIINHGGDAFAKLGVGLSGGTRLFSVSGHIKNPGVYELPMTFTIKQLIDHCGGIPDGKKLKAIIPGGASAPMMTADEIETPLDFDSIAKAGSMAGSGAIIVMDETTCIVEAAARLLKFYEHESCGQCSQCREGSHWLARLFDRLEKGLGNESDLALIEDICSNMIGQTICAFSEAMTGPALSSIRKFKSEFLEHINNKGCPHKLHLKEKEVSHVL